MTARQRHSEYAGRTYRQRMEISVTALPGWMVSRPEGLTAADYDALPEEISRRI
jgi:hypothetical protein